MLDETVSRRPRWHRREIGVAVALYLAVFMAMLDVSVVVLALPAIQADLDASPSTTQWVIAAYTLSLSVLAISAGALADRYGRKRVFLLGVGVFTAASALCALAPTPLWLIVARLVQGVGAAILVPGTLGLIARAFADPARRAAMIAGWSTVAGAAALSGPVIGGLLVDAVGWPSIFLINLPLGAIVLGVGSRVLAESADPEHADLDLVGQLLGIAWLGALSYALLGTGEHGWSTPTTLVPLAIALAILPIFLVVEWRQPRPMLPVRLFTDRRFALPNAAAFATGFSLFAVGVFLPTFLQQAQGRSAAQAGFIALPAAAVAILAPILTGRWLARTGPRPPLVAGLAVTAAGLIPLLAVGPGSGWWPVMACMAVLNVGYSLAGPASNAAALAAVAPARSGTASAVIGAIRQVGTTLGIAVLGAILATHLADAPAPLPDRFTAGLHAALPVAIAVVLIAGLLALLLPAAGRDPRTDQPASGDERPTPTEPERATR